MINHQDKTIYTHLIKGGHIKKFETAEVMVILLKSILGRNRSLFESSVEKEISSDAGEKFPASLLVETVKKKPHIYASTTGFKY